MSWFLTLGAHAHEDYLVCFRRFLVYTIDILQRAFNNYKTYSEKAFIKSYRSYLSSYDSDCFHEVWLLKMDWAPRSVEDDYYTLSLLE